MAVKVLMLVGIGVIFLALIVVAIVAVVQYMNKDD